MALLVDAVRQKMKKGRRRVEPGFLQIGIGGHIRGTVKTAPFHTADKRPEIAEAGFAGNKRGLFLAKHRLSTSPRQDSYKSGALAKRRLAMI